MFLLHLLGFGAELLLIGLAEMHVVRWDGRHETVGHDGLDGARDELGVVAGGDVNVDVAGVD